MLFEKPEINWSDNINIICGENSTGKTTLLKILYSMLKPIGKNHAGSLTKEISRLKFGFPEVSKVIKFDDTLYYRKFGMKRKSMWFYFLREILADIQEVKKWLCKNCKEVWTVRWDG